MLNANFSAGWCPFHNTLSGIDYICKGNSLVGLTVQSNLKDLQWVIIKFGGLTSLWTWDNYLGIWEWSGSGISIIKCWLLFCFRHSSEINRDGKVIPNLLGLFAESEKSINIWWWECVLFCFLHYFFRCDRKRCARSFHNLKCVIDHSFMETFSVCFTNNTESLQCLLWSLFMTMIPCFNQIHHVGQTPLLNPTSLWPESNTEK